MEEMRGIMTIFGGTWDTFEAPEYELSLYSHWEADLRPDLFNHRSLDRNLGTSRRLKDSGLYFAYQYDKDRPREWLQKQVYRFTNPNTNRSILCQLVDYSPKKDSNVMYRISPHAATLLGLRTDEEVIGEPL